MVRVAFGAQTIHVTIGGQAVVVRLGENTAEAARQRALAETAAAIALTAAGPNYADTVAGLAATTEGDTFAVDNGDGTVTVYAHDAGPVATALRSFIKDHATLIEVLDVPATVAAQVTAAQSAQTAAAADAANALAARLLAEAARDAVLAGNVYPDTAAGLAAVAEGEYFFVAGAGETLLTLYRDVAGVATVVGTMASGAAVSGLLGGASASDQLLKEWTEAEAYRGVFATPDQLAAASTAAITWPDGSTGTFTITTWNATFAVPDAWTVTHVLSGRKVTQAAITRTAKGNPSARPALTVGAI